MTKTERLQELIEIAYANKIVKSQLEFARFIGAKDSSTLSHTLKGDPGYNPDRLIAIAENALMKAGLPITIDAPVKNTQENSGVITGDQVQKNIDGITNEDVREIVNMLVTEMAEQRKSHERELMALIEKIK